MSRLKNKNRSLRLGALLGMVALSGLTGCGEGLPDPTAAPDEAAARLADPRTAILDAHGGEVPERSPLSTAATTDSSQPQPSGSASVTDSDTTPPTTKLTAPGLLATVKGTITVSATASDDVGVTRVEFYVGTQRIGSDTTSPYSMSWDSKKIANNLYLVSSKAYDAAGNVGIAPNVLILVKN